MYVYLMTIQFIHLLVAATDPNISTPAFSLKHMRAAQVLQC